MICPGWRARCCHCVRNIPVSVVFFPLEKSLDAFAARYRLAEMSEHTLDVQYYIWQDDMSGRLLFSALLAAAKRGVRVRLLLDDNNTPGLDDILRLLDSHPRIEVRLFNPFSFRLLRPLGYITDFSRLNRRMHNKSFTVDGVVTLVGGEILVMPILGQGKSHFFGFRCHGNRTRSRGRCR